jgi:hypothetical protein
MAFSVFPTPSVGVRIFSVAKIFTSVTLLPLCKKKTELSSVPFKGQH